MQELIEIGFASTRDRSIPWDVRPLFRALENLFPVRIRACRIEEIGGFVAAIVVAEPEEAVIARCDVPRDMLVYQVAYLHPKPRVQVERSRNRFTHDIAVPPLFRGQEFDETNSVHAQALAAGEAERVLATRDSRPIWVLRLEPGRACWRTGIPWPCLEVNEWLGKYYCPGSFMRLLPLLTFLNRVAEPIRYCPPPTLACWVFDDPNLLRIRYGCLDFRALATHASKHGYHAAIAVPPLRASGALPAVASLFKKNSAHLSIAIHGNNHTKRELLSHRTNSASLRLLSQALRRASGFTNHTCLPVSRIIDPPHGVVAAEHFKAMVSLNFDACLVTPSQFLPENPDYDQDHVFGLRPMEMSPDGLCILPRIVMSRHWRLELALASSLGQPLLLVGHHQDVAGGFSILQQFAEVVHSLPGASFGSLEDIATSMSQARLDGAMLRIRLGTRRAHVTVPAGIPSVVIERPWVRANRRESLRVHERHSGYDLVRELGLGIADPIPLPETDRARELIIQSAPSPLVDWAEVAQPRFAVWPSLRMILTETRDRLTGRFHRASRIRPN